MSNDKKIINLKLLDFLKTKKLTKNIKKYKKILFNLETCHVSKRGNNLYIKYLKIGSIGPCAWLAYDTFDGS